MIEPLNQKDLDLLTRPLPRLPELENWLLNEVWTSRRFQQSGSSPSQYLKSGEVLVNEKETAAKGGRGWIYAGAVISLVAVLLSPLASADPDGLERVAEDIGFLAQGQDAPYQILPDYTIPFLGETALSTIVAGMVGALVVLGIMILVGNMLRRKKAHSHQ